MVGVQSLVRLVNTDGLPNVIGSFIHSFVRSFVLFFQALCCVQVICSGGMKMLPMKCTQIGGGTTNLLMILILILIPPLSNVGECGEFCLCIGKSASKM